MNYTSTRSQCSLSPSEAVLRGLAEDGGLYIYPDLSSLRFDWRSTLKKSAFGMAEDIFTSLLPDIPNIQELVYRAYHGKFASDELTPLVRVGEDHVLELFRGPTSAFKDVALSMLPQLMTASRALQQEKDKTVILTATSGDTGKAALEGFHDVPGTGILVFYPAGGVSPVQRAQMVTQEGKNVRVCAVRGNFDDCQTGVKECFAALAQENLHGKKLSSANSINIGRLIPQIVYYFIAYARLLDEGSIRCGEAVDFVVPTGNFGDILAGYYAKLLGLPVGMLVCASNANRVLTDFLSTGIYDRRREFQRTSSPSMDILVSSNLERLLYLACEDPDEVRGYMNDLREKGFYQVSERVRAYIAEHFACACCDEAGSAAEIARVWSEEQYLMDPHTAVASAAAQEWKRRRAGSAPVVILSTASPYKFPAAVLSAIGGTLTGDEFEEMEQLSALTGTEIPKNLATLREKKELHLDEIDRTEITAYVRAALTEEDWLC